MTNNIFVFLQSNFCKQVSIFHSIKTNKLFYFWILGLQCLFYFQNSLNFSGIWLKLCMAGYIVLIWMEDTRLASNTVHHRYVEASNTFILILLVSNTKIIFYQQKSQTCIFSNNTNGNILSTRQPCCSNNNYIIAVLRQYSKWWLNI